MSITNLLGLLGGLALFLYGMQMMSDGLENAAGDKMKDILEKLTANRFMGVAVGAAVTAIIQSSSATTVMVVGFVNSGMMTLKQAVWIIMGANIGTTITGQLVALDVGELAPLFAFLGVAMIVFTKKPKLHHYGLIGAGLGVLFIGMDMMSSAMVPLRESEAFVSLMTSFSNPLFGILGGAIFTAIIQSSSASVGILQTLANNGLISFQNSVFVLFGQNIGTCITAVLASIGTGTNAKRTTIIHLSFNLIGTAIFTILCLLFPIADVVGSFTPGLPASQIANMHTTFNIVTTCLLLPFGEYLAKFAEIVLKDKEVKEENPLLADFNENYSLGNAAIFDDVLHTATNNMLLLAKDNVQNGFESLINHNLDLVEEIKKREKVINKTNKQIVKYVAKCLAHTHNNSGISNIEKYLEISSNIERIGDHALNLSEYEDTIEEGSLHFSTEAQEEIKNMKTVCEDALRYLTEVKVINDDFIIKISGFEQKIDDLTETYRNNHVQRIKNGICEGEACVLYSEILLNFERIGDHVLNIGEALVKMKY